MKQYLKITVVNNLSERTLVFDDNTKQKDWLSAGYSPRNFIWVPHQKYLLFYLNHNHINVIFSTTTSWITKMKLLPESSFNSVYTSHQLFDTHAAY